MAINSVSKKTIAKGLRGGSKIWDEPTLGSSFGGGYYAGVIAQGGLRYFLVVSPKSFGENSSAEWKTSSTVGPASAVTLNNGPSSSSSMNSVDHPAAWFCEGLSIGGYTDWYMPSRDELELCYRNLKPDATSNVINRAPSAYVYPENNDVYGDGGGVNRNSLPVGSGYTVSAPAKTTISAFQSGGGEAFSAATYLSSSESSSTSAWSQSFSTGEQFSNFSKSTPAYVRAVRRVQIQFYRIEPPVINTPANLATSVGRLASIVAGAFSITPTGSDAHISSDWQVATDPGFTSLVISTTGDVANKTSITPQLNNLVGFTAHYVRVRYNGSANSSVWSQPVKFTTAGVSTPSITSPSNAAKNVSRGLEIQASAFSSTDTGAHYSSDWQVASDSGFSNIAWSSMGSTVNKTSITLPANTLSPNQSYYVRVRYASTTGPSSWSGAVQFSTGAPNFGEPFGGGYYAGTISISGVSHYVVVAPKSSGEAIKLWKTAATADTGSASTYDGLANSNNMNNTSHPAAYFCRGLSIGGYVDWYHPAKDELELCYRNLKPSTGSNHTSSGVNSNSYPAGSFYTSSYPAQTTADGFKLGEAEAFEADYYWTSTSTDGSTGALIQRFSSGYQLSSSKNAGYYVRAVRRVQAI